LDRYVVIPATEPGDWQLLERPLGVMPGRLFLLTWEGGMPNDKPLKPDDFPVEVEGDELMTADGKPIAKAKTPDIAEDIVDVSTKTITAKNRTDGRLDLAGGRGEAAAHRPQHLTRGGVAPVRCMNQTCGVRPR
jgi:hypothetical protein